MLYKIRDISIKRFLLYCAVFDPFCEKTLILADFYPHFGTPSTEFSAYKVQLRAQV